MKHRFPHLAALDGAIDKQEKARNWLIKFDFILLVRLADAVNENPEAIAWFDKNELHVFLVIAQQIKNFRNRQTFDYHKNNSDKPKKQEFINQNSCFLFLIIRVR